MPISELLGLFWVGKVEAIKSVELPYFCMVLDSLSGKEKQGLAAAFAVAVVASLAAGYVGGNMGVVEDSGDSASTDEIRSTAQSIMDQQVAAQQQQLALMANQTENVSESDLSLNAEVEDVSESEFGSLYEVTVSVTGDTVGQTGEMQSIDEEQTLYISEDGRYLFSEPTDLEAQQQQQQMPSGAQ